jgi:XTP/dITP diphosphohydrolase
MKNKIILASKNKGKIKEVREIWDGTDIDLISLIDLEDFSEIEESGTTFEQNARIKAEAVYRKYKLPSIADDSGIIAEQLFGAPGVYSARYAGIDAADEDNNRKLIRELEKFKEPHYASYICFAVFFDGNEFKIARGEVKGKIIKEPRGQNGFGYDPLFIPEGYSLTMGELPADEKNKISHRGKAFKNLKNILHL